MKRIFLLSMLVMLLLACTEKSEIIDSNMKSTSGEILDAPIGLDTKKEDIIDDIKEEETGELPVSDIRSSWDNECVEQSEAYFGELLILTPFEIQTIFRKSDTNNCIVSYYLVNESAIHSYVLLDLETKEIIDEVNCFPEYDVENDTLKYCEEEDLEKLRLEYETLLEKNL